MSTKSRGSSCTHSKPQASAPGPGPTDRTELSRFCRVFKHSVGISPHVSDRLLMSSNDTDQMLIAAIARRDEAAFGTLYLRYHRRVGRFLAVNLPRCKTAEEVVNDTLWIVWQNAGQFKGSSQVSTWIMGIAFHVGVRSLRKSQRALADVKALQDVPESTHNPWSESEIGEWIAAGLARLPDEQRKVLELAYHLGHSCAEIAESVNCPVGTVKTRMHHGRRKLKLLLPNLAGSSSKAIQSEN
jgi:RNA polymerase sigma-70 factor, ECF subfamily